MGGRGGEGVAAGDCLAVGPQLHSTLQMDLWSSSQAMAQSCSVLNPTSQMTIMSRSCAERCNLLRLMDRRFAGMAVGVGSAKILGALLAHRLHYWRSVVGAARALQWATWSSSRLQAGAY